jgi:hypothetical protein
MGTNEMTEVSDDEILEWAKRTGIEIAEEHVQSIKKVYNLKVTTLLRVEIEVEVESTSLDAAKSSVDASEFEDEIRLAFDSSELKIDWQEITE